MKSFAVKTARVLATVLQLAGIVLITGAVIYAAQWGQFAYKIITICDEYPAMFADCRE